MAAITICSDFWSPPKIKSNTTSTVSPSVYHEVMRPDAMILVFWMLSFKPAFHFHQEALRFLFAFCCKGAVTCVSEITDISHGNFDSSCVSSSPAFLLMSFAYKLNKQGDNIQPLHTPFPICNQSIVPCLVLTVASWPAYRFLKRQVRWSGIHISWRIFQNLLWSTQSKALT